MFSQLKSTTSRCFFGSIFLKSLYSSTFRTDSAVASQSEELLVVHSWQPLYTGEVTFALHGSSIVKTPKSCPQHRSKFYLFPKECKRDWPEWLHCHRGPLARHDLLQKTEKALPESTETEVKKIGEGDQGRPPPLFVAWKLQKSNSSALEGHDQLCQWRGIWAAPRIIVWHHLIPTFFRSQRYCPQLFFTWT